MALNVKILGVVAVLGGGGIALPLYLKNRGSNDPVLKGQDQVNKVQEQERSPSANTSRTTRSAESIEQVSCNISDFSSAPKDRSDFVKDSGNQVELYSFVSCTNPAVKGSAGSYLGEKWDGLFPTNVLKEKLSYAGGEKFEIKATVIKEEDHLGNGVPVITFSSQSNQNAIKSKWDIEETNFQKKALVIPVNGISQGPNKIYLFVEPKGEELD